MTSGIGIDAIETARIRESLERTPGFEVRVFSPDESAYCRAASGNLCFERFAARFAAKEAFLKATGDGLANGWRLNEITVVHDINKKPELRLSGHSLEKFEKEIGGRILLSLTHLADRAEAFVLIDRP
ncbi:MAG: holo-ACP synthase [Fibrobacterota bacterium]